jgi:hypothetical protein
MIGTEMTIYITDKTGRKMWNTSVTYGYHEGELKNQRRRLDRIRAGRFPAIDTATVRMVMEMDGVEMGAGPQTDEDLLADLGL